MRRWLIALGLVAAVTLAVVAATTYQLHSNAARVTRARMIAADLQQLRVAKSDFNAARSIAEKYGTVPYENHYGALDCTAGYFERCTYMLALNNSRLHRMLAKYPSLRQLGVSDWGGTALIYINKGKVLEYYFSIVYRAKDGQWRGIGAEELPTLPEDRAVQARMSDSYSIERNDIRMGDEPADLGFDLEASLNPAASAVERKRAWNFSFNCLANRSGCGEICEVMPDGWRDFYVKRGHFDVEKYGSAYLFCRKPPA